MAAAGDLLRPPAELAEHLAGETADAELEAVEIAGLLDLVAEPAPHLAASVAGEQIHEIIFLGELVHQLQAVAVMKPGILLARIEAERHRAEQREGRGLADVVV